MANYCLRLMIAAFLAWTNVWAVQAAEPTRLTWYGHAAFKIVTPKGHVLLLDPWLENPSNKNGKADVANLGKVDLILITHGHFDHVGQATEIAQKTKARLVATYDLGNALADYANYPKDQMGFDSLGNFGGVVTFFDGEVKIAFVPAVHSSTINSKALGVNQDDSNHFAGNPGGFVVIIKDGPTFYHTGDTDYFEDMADVRQYGKIDVMLACIGDHFTMGTQRAAAAVALVQPRIVVPMHYGTFPVLTGTPLQFEVALKARGLAKKFMSLQIDVPMAF